MYVVIMAGGSGTRFWPMSRASRPKQFLTIVGDTPMVVATYERVKSMVSDERVVLVVGEEHRIETERLFAGLNVRILAEPMGRNTAPCIGLAAGFIEFLGSDEPMVILPADHYVADPKALCEAIRKAADVAVNGGIVTLGIVPTRPETGYGYIERDDSDAGSGGNGQVFRVKKFVEKPDTETAVKYLAGRNFYWNAGIFVATPRTLLDAFEADMPSFRRGLDELKPVFGTPHFSDALRKLYEKTDGISFDYAIMEKASQSAYVIPCDCGWSDVGSWLSLYELKKNDRCDDSGNVQEGKGLLLNCRDTFVMSHGKRYVAALGLRKVLVVDTEDALLVADIERSQEIRDIINALKAADLKDLL